MNNLELLSKVYNTLLYNIDDEIRNVSESLVNNGNILHYQINHMYYDLESRDGILEMKNKYSYDITIKVIDNITFKNNIELYKALKEIDDKIKWKGFLHEIMPIVADRIIMTIDEYDKKGINE